MLTPFALGVLALLVFWQTTLLVTWATVREVAALRRRAGNSPRVTRLLAAICVTLAGAAACTALTLWPPLFGSVSTLGGVASLAFFLLVQPLGTALRDHARATPTTDRA